MPDVCMESTGKYWIPVYDILERQGLKPVLTHSKYVKQANGHKTDFRDAIHMANLFRMDLAVPSFISPADIRDLRELCRYRLKLTYTRISEKNRYHNFMVVFNIRLDFVFSDLFGKSASARIQFGLLILPHAVAKGDCQVRDLTPRHTGT
ncbi:MAG: IS110 family transposase [Lachnospiraceae bacterium]|nr:IS110 family transposase [Lachnospiraceae bacterium]